MNNYKVYKHTSPSGKVYVGITRNDTKRRWKNGQGYVSNAHFYRAIQRYGWESFKHEIVTEGLTEEEATEKERALIALYDSTNPARGYNVEPGGETRAPTTAAKISATLTGRHLSAECKQHMSVTRKGRKLTEEQKKKISVSHKVNPKVLAHIIALNKKRAGTPKAAETKRKMAESQPRRRRVQNIDTGEVFDSIRRAAEACKGAHANIVKACTGERRTAYGYRWAYKEEDKKCI